MASCMGSNTSWSHLAGGEYRSRSNEAHTVLSLGLLGVVLLWSANLLLSVRFRLILSLVGLLQLAMGLYLLSWLWRLAPGAVLLLDLLQLQHLAIATHLVAAGLVDLALGREGLIGDDLVEIFLTTWGINVQGVGAQFMAHPQMSHTNRTIHLFLGFAIISGTSFLLTEKRRAFEYGRLMESLGVLFTAALFGAAAILLARFDEIPEVSGQHRSILASCDGAALFAQGSMICSLVSIFFLVLACLWSNGKTQPVESSLEEETRDYHETSSQRRGRYATVVSNIETS